MIGRKLENGIQSLTFQIGDWTSGLQEFQNKRIAWISVWIRFDINRKLIRTLIKVWSVLLSPIKGPRQVIWANWTLSQENHLLVLDKQNSSAEVKPFLLSQAVGDCRETVFVGHDRAIAHRNSQWLWPSARDLHKIKPDKIPAWRVQVVKKSYLFSRNYWKLMFSGKGGVRFLNDPSPKRLPMLLQMVICTAI